MTPTLLAFAALLSLPAFGATPALACPDTITISRGDTLSAVAAACGMNVESLMQANPGLRPNRLQPGMVIDVPVMDLRSNQFPYNRPQVGIAPPIAQTGPGIQTPTNLKGPEIRSQRPLYFDPTQQTLPGQMPMPGQPGSPGYPLPLR